MNRNLSMLLAVLLLLALSAGDVGAQADDACVDPAGNGYQLCGDFRAYWEVNDGARQFGGPLSDAFEETQFSTGATQIVQYSSASASSCTRTTPARHTVCCSAG
ncbi:hypothetical protein BH23CHL2_BH23CHL2_31820 [soil metagenome]